MLCTRILEVYHTFHPLQLGDRSSQFQVLISNYIIISRPCTFTTDFLHYLYYFCATFEKLKLKLQLNTIFIMFFINFCIMFYPFDLTPKVLDISNNIPTAVSLIYFHCIFIIYSHIMIFYMVQIQPLKS